jgi:hypothetical protein
MSKRKLEALCVRLSEVMILQIRESEIAHT